MRILKDFFRHGLLLVAVVSVMPAHSASGSAFGVEAEFLPSIALEAFSARFPEVPADRVELAPELYFNCNASPNIAGASGIKHATLSCMATVNLNVSATGVEHFYMDAEGFCRVLKPEIATVHVSPDGSSRVHFHPSNVHEGNYIECGDEAITAMAQVDQRTAAVDNAFGVDAAAILELAFAAASGAFAGIPEEQIVYGDGPSLSVACHAGEGKGGLASGQAIVEGCTARVRFANEAVRVDYRTIRDGRCMIGRASDWITVKVDQDGFTETRASRNTGIGRARTVDCDADFENSTLPLIAEPHLAD